MPSTAVTVGWVPTSDSTSTGSSRNGAAATPLANLDENSPKVACSERCSMKPATRPSQKAWVPPLPSMIS